MQYDEQTQQKMFAMISSWRQSGLSQKIYCEQNDIRYYVFQYWYKRYKDNQATAENDRFISVNVKAAPSLNASAAQIELLTADGKRILFYQPVSSDYLKALIS